MSGLYLVVKTFSGRTSPGDVQIINSGNPWMSKMHEKGLGRPTMTKMMRTAAKVAAYEVFLIAGEVLRRLGVGEVKYW